MKQEAAIQEWDYEASYSLGNFVYVPRLDQEENDFLEKMAIHQDFVRRMPSLDLQVEEEHLIEVRFSPELGKTVLEYVAAEGLMINPVILPRNEAVEVAGGLERYTRIKNRVVPIHTRIDVRRGLWEAEVAQLPGSDKPEIPFELVRVFMYGDPPKSPESWE